MHLPRIPAKATPWPLRMTPINARRGLEPIHGLKICPNRITFRTTLWRAISLMVAPLLASCHSIFGAPATLVSALGASDYTMRAGEIVSIPFSKFGCAGETNDIGDHITGIIISKYDVVIDLKEAATLSDEKSFATWKSNHLWGLGLGPQGLAGTAAVDLQKRVVYFSGGLEGVYLLSAVRGPAAIGCRAVRCCIKGLRTVLNM